MNTTIDRLNIASQQVAKLEQDLNGSNRLTKIVGAVLLLFMAGYFVYGYQQIQSLVEPSQLVPLGAQMLEDNLPEARQAVIRQVSDSAPAWAEQVSVKLRDELPGVRGKLEEYVLKETDKMLEQAATISEERVRKALRDNKDILDTHIRELATSEELSEASAAALVTALEGELQKDLKDQSELVLDTVRLLDSRVRDLAKGVGLDEEEQVERRILMLARRLQLSEADKTPIAAPYVKPLVKAEVPAATDAPAVTEALTATDAPAATATDSPAVTPEVAAPAASDTPPAPDAKTPAPEAGSATPETPAVPPGS